MFRAETENAVTAETAGRPLPEISLTDLSAGRLSIICSSLARGCEKQYRTEEASLFRELAEYFRTITPAPENADLNDLAGEIHKDADHYRNVRAAADAEGADAQCGVALHDVHDVAEGQESRIKEGRYQHDGDQYDEYRRLFVAKSALDLIAHAVAPFAQINEPESFQFRLFT